MSDRGGNMMRQYRSIKERHSKEILFFRLGDFYEMFYEDAVISSQLLDLALTNRQGVPMCGIPHHAAQRYVARLLKLGRKVAICEQIEDRANNRKLARREVVEVVTPGVSVVDGHLDSGRNNFLMALTKYGNRLCEAYLDLSTGELEVASFVFEQAPITVKSELSRIDPNEVIVSESLLAEYPAVTALFGDMSSIVLNRVPDWYFNQQQGCEKLCRHFGTLNLKSFALRDDNPSLCAVAALFDYVESNAKQLLGNIQSIREYRIESHVMLDESARRNLELVKNLQDRSERFTLLAHLDHTLYSPGRRRLRKWILCPLRDRDEILERQSEVKRLFNAPSLLRELREILKQTNDLERLVGRVTLGRATPPDILGIADMASRCVNIYQLLTAPLPREANRGSVNGDVATISNNDAAATNIASPSHVGAASNVDASDCRVANELAETLCRALVDNPSNKIDDGNIIRQGYDSERDRLQTLRDSSNKLLNDYLEEERANTKIANLKIRFNRILGYFFEVTKTNLHRVPSYFMRRQSMTNVDRFTTERLSELEIAINNAKNNLIEAEIRIIEGLFAEIMKLRDCVMRLSDMVAEVDCVQSLAWVALLYGYVCPEIANERGITITQGCHPVVKEHTAIGEFTPNSVEFSSRRQLALITGPNMAGKSTYLRQTALIVLMAHIGSFVPAESAVIGLVDAIFCRVGASDNLAQGESTFLVEMSEVAYILRNATDRSLIIMDEVGRGTATRDGAAIAQAVVEHILNVVTAFCLFATHFHELSNIEHRAMVNLSLMVKEEHGTIVFLRRVQEGPSQKSYGIHVAKLAGVPDAVVAQAERYLSRYSMRDYSSSPNVAKEAVAQRELW